MVMHSPQFAGLSGRAEGSGQRGRFAARASRFSICCGAAAAVGGLVVLAGWTLGVDRLKNLSPGTVSMRPNAAAALALVGLALVLCLRNSRASIARGTVAVLAALATAIGALTLIEYATGADLGIDQVLFHEPVVSAGALLPGRMAVLTAVALVFSGCSLALLLSNKTTVQQALAAGATAIAVSALLGYLYGTSVTRPWGTGQVSAYTVALLTTLGLGLLTAKPQAGFVGALLGDTPGGLMARWLLLAAVIVLPGLGALRLAGQHAGLYGAGAGVGIMVLASLLVLVVVVSVTAIRLNALGGERSLALRRLAESDRRLRRALEQLLHVQENERRGLAVDLHDDALPALSGIGLQLELVRGQSTDHSICERLGQAEAELRATRVRLRHLMLDLIPDALEREGLGGALRHRLQQMEELNGIEYELNDRLRRQPSAAATAVLYRIALEALRNITRHADATRVRVDIEQSDSRVTVSINDDGVGFERSTARPGHFGLSIMAARAELAGGQILIDSKPGNGTAVTFWVPLGVQRILDTG